MVFCSMVFQFWKFTRFIENWIKFNITLSICPFFLFLFFFSTHIECNKQMLWILWKNELEQNIQSITWYNLWMRKSKCNKIKWKKNANFMHAISFECIYDEQSTGKLFNFSIQINQWLIYVLCISSIKKKKKNLISMHAKQQFQSLHCDGLGEHTRHLPESQNYTQLALLFCFIFLCHSSPKNIHNALLSFVMSQEQPIRYYLL